MQYPFNYFLSKSHCKYRLMKKLTAAPTIASTMVSWRLCQGSCKYMLNEVPLRTPAFSSNLFIGLRIRINSLHQTTQ